MKNRYIALLLTASMLSPMVVLADTAPAETPDTEVTATTTADIQIEPTAEPASEITAEPTPAPTVESSAEPMIVPEEQPLDPAITSTTVGVDIYIGDHQVEIDSSAHFNLFNSNGELIGTDEHWIGGDTKHIHLGFTVEPYEMGEVFTLGFVDGFHSLTYYSETKYPGEHIELATYAMKDESGNIVHGNNFALDAEPNYERGLNFYYNGQLVELTPRGRLVDGIGMMSAESVGKALGMIVEYHPDYNSLTMSASSEQLIFNIDTTYATFFGTDLELSHAPVWIDDSVYVPIRDVLNALGCSIELWQDEDHIDVIAPLSPVIQEIRSRERVNREGITSRTNYLIWVSKSDFTVKVYKGSRYNWECIRTAPCAIGAPWTPTIEGQFEYQYAGGRWDYGSYYVWPTMMFYGGYALHSTLRRTGGGMYDDRVGVMISHGCVRLHPADIDWIYATIPLKTRIYVTP